MSKIFVDYDDTLTTGEGERYWIDSLDDHPDWGIIELVNDLYKKGNTIIVYTARREEVREETQYFLDKWGVMHHALVMEKPGFDLLIDDRSISDQSALKMSAEEIEEYING
jgi:hypothetical protein